MKRDSIIKKSPQDNNQNSGLVSDWSMLLRKTFLLLLRKKLVRC